MNTNCGLDENGALVKDTGSDAVNMIGEIKILAQSTIPENCLPCNGAAVSRTAYAELFAAIGTTYGEGDGSTTFNVPDAEGVLYGNQGRTIGESIAEGLPNITGTLSAVYSSVRGQYNGALSMAAPSSGEPSTISGAGSVGINFDASLSNAIYGASAHVQPQGITFNVVIVFA